MGYYLLTIKKKKKKTNAKLPINVNFTCFIVSYTFLFFYDRTWNRFD